MPCDHPNTKQHASHSHAWCHGPWVETSGFRPWYLDRLPLVLASASVWISMVLRRKPSTHIIVEFHLPTTRLSIAQSYSAAGSSSGSMCEQMGDGDFTESVETNRFALFNLA